MIPAGLVGIGIGLFTDQPLSKDIKDMAYYNNPWELIAYAIGGTGSGRGTLAWW